MEFCKHNWATISETICPEMLIFGKQASWTLFFQNIRTNTIISEISEMTSHFSTLYSDLCYICPPLRCVKTGNKKRATCPAKLLQNQFNSDVARFTTPIKPLTRFLLPVFTHLMLQIIMQILADDLYVHGSSLYRTQPHGYNHL